MYLLQKYDALSGLDHAEFISKDVPPWHISDDTCGPQPEPPVTWRCEDEIFDRWAVWREVWQKDPWRNEHQSSDGREAKELKMIHFLAVQFWRSTWHPQPIQSLDRNGYFFGNDTEEISEVTVEQPGAEYK